MKKLAVLLAVLTVMGGNAAYAQNMGQGANAGSNTGSNGMAWGIGLGALAVVATVAGVAAASGAKDPSTFSH